MKEKWKGVVFCASHVRAYMLQSAASQLMMRVPYEGDHSTQEDHRTPPNQHVQQLR
jgi:hypothetical protein